MKLVGSDLTGAVAPAESHAAERPASAARRGRIVDAALKLFSETAYDSVQMDDLARAAGVAKPTLYRYFATKEELFLEGIERTLGDLEHEAEAAAAASADAREGLSAVVRCVLDSLGRCTAAIRAFDDGETAIGERGRAVIRRRVKRIRVTLEHLVEAAVAAGQFRPVDPELAALAILGAVRMTAAHVPARRRHAAAAGIVDLFLSGLAPASLGVEPSPAIDTDTAA
jgi:AcrR family transcriptional regulator